MDEPTLKFDIVRTSHVELLVRDLERSRRFYVESLGFVETFADSDHIYLRGYEDRFHHCLVLTKSTNSGVGHISFRVRRESDLQGIEQLFRDANLPVMRIDRGRAEVGQGPAIRAQDPFGFPVEFFHEMEESEWLLQKFHRFEKAKIMRIDHVNILYPRVDPVSEWYTNKLGFLVSEYTVGDPSGGGSIWATWLRRKPSVHDVAIMTGRGPRLHHIGFIVQEKGNILDCADILASNGFLGSLERGPGRHGISNAFFLYLRDPDGHRIELYTGDYLIADPNWQPKVWSLSDPQRQTFWGAPAPDSWFNEASEVRSVFDEEKSIPTSEPKSDQRPKSSSVSLAH